MASTGLCNKNTEAQSTASAFRVFSPRGKQDTKIQWQWDTTSDIMQEVLLEAWSTWEQHSAQTVVEIGSGPDLLEKVMLKLSLEGQDKRQAAKVVFTGK